MLCLSMFVGMVPAQAYGFEWGDRPQTLSLRLEEEDGVEVVELPENEKVTLTADPLDADSYQWQILAVPALDLWVDISGQTGYQCDLSYPMVASLLDDENSVLIRCKCLMDGETVMSDPVTVTVTDPTEPELLPAPDEDPIILSDTIVETNDEPADDIIDEPIVEPSDEPADEPSDEPTDEPSDEPADEPSDEPADEPSDEPADEPSDEPTDEPSDEPTDEPFDESAAEPSEKPADEPVATPAPAARFSARSLRAATYDLESDDGTKPSTYNLVINYVFGDGSQAAPTYTATLGAGISHSATINFPQVLGYLPYYKNVQQDSLVLNIENIDKDYTYTVVYQPTLVDYTVSHYYQNVDNDQYTKVEEEAMTGLTGNYVPEVAWDKDADTTNDPEGFYSLLYEKPAIAADGSTEVDVYYDRYYYLMNFDLDGGYGVEPIYARYGTPISVGTPTKAGYTFMGWTLAGEKVQIPETMPAESRTYKALWQPGDTAKVTIVFWGENADDEEYSYIKSQEVYVKPGTEFTYPTCGQEEHTHDPECYAGVGSQSYAGTGAPANPKNGYVYRKALSREKVIYINGVWYEYTGNTNTGDIAPTICGEIEHTHNDSCYQGGSVMDPSLWTFMRSDTVTVAADGSTVVNVYYDRTTFTLKFVQRNQTIKTIGDTKWGADIHTNFPITDNNGNTMWWDVPNNCESFVPGNYLASINTMPAEDITFSYHDSESGAVIYYYVETIDGAAGVYSHDGKNFTEYKTINIKYSNRKNLTYTEEFHDIIGFTQWWSDPEFTPMAQGGTADMKWTNILCYARNSFAIEYYNPTELLKKEQSVPYQKELDSYYWEPTPEQAPAKYEPGSVEFGGWYLNPECTGEQFDFTTQTMPAGPNNKDGEVALSLYAKWVPVSHTVEFYLDKDALDAETKLTGYPDLEVPHGSMVDPAPADPENGSYTFVGWFYMENGVEKAFDFENMPVTKDMKVYGKWSSNVLMQYTVYYKYQDENGNVIEIADPTNGSGLAGSTKTFDAKGGEDLYEKYQEGFFPLTQSSSITLSMVEGENECTFWYKPADNVPYTVKYLEKGTNAVLHTEKSVAENRKAVVTETFVPISGYLPDAYQKRLVLTVKEDGTPDNEANVIIFYYEKDELHAYYTITHYTENLDGGWTQYGESSQIVGNIDQSYTAKSLDIPGFTYDKSQSTEDGTLTANGLELKLYYTRNSYPYEVHYREYGTNKELHAPDKLSDKFGKVVSATAIPIEDYEVVGDATKPLTIQIDTDPAGKNIITFYYKEKEVTINYVAVGPEGSGTVSLASETLPVRFGNARGSTATANTPVYKFVGWYSDADCTTLVSEELKFVPDKVNDKNKAATYYAKFDYDTFDLVITKTMETGVTAEQDFIFDVKKDGVVVTTVVIKAKDVNAGKGTVTITKLQGSVDDYEVVERGDWSWKYVQSGKSELTLKDGAVNTYEVTFTNKESDTNWMGASSIATNDFTLETDQNKEDADLPESRKTDQDQDDPAEENEGGR